MEFVECLDTHSAFCNVAFIRGFINGGIQQAIMRAKGARGKAPKNLDYSQNNLPAGMGLNAVGSAPFPRLYFVSLCIREKPDKGGMGRGEEESEEKTVGERGERPVFVGFSNF
ncbi:MAG: hypothetical protein J6A19_12620, partial [Oscillospiraceae bacterium]|nr:hypothetical protein [Oscillospiraceae bacterium]